MAGVSAPGFAVRNFPGCEQFFFETLRPLQFLPDAGYFDDVRPDPENQNLMSCSLGWWKRVEIYPSFTEDSYYHKDKQPSNKTFDPGCSAETPASCGLTPARKSNKVVPPEEEETDPWRASA
jgi:hypothetical protein